MLDTFYFYRRFAISFSVAVIMLATALIPAGWNRAIAAEPAAAINLIPRPVKLVPLAGAYSLTAQTTIVTDGASESTGHYLAEVLQPIMGTMLTVRTDGAAEPSRAIVLRIDPALKTLGSEGYMLDVTPGKIVMRAMESAGIFYACQTLRQLLPRLCGPMAGGSTENSTANSASWLIPCVHIEDRPRFAWRGLMLDCAIQNFLSKELIRRYIDLLAMHKMNRLHLHLTDFGLWTLEIQRYPELTNMKNWWMAPAKGNRGFYRQDDIRELVRYAATRHVMLIPEIETINHNVIPCIALRDKLLCRNNPYRNSDRPHNTEHLKQWCEPCVAQPESLEVYKNILDETMALFPGPYIHLGGDEYFGVSWEACPDCKALIEKEHLRDHVPPGVKELFSKCLGWHEKYLLYRHWITKLCNHVTSRGRTPILWDDLAWRADSPVGAVVMQWHFKGGGDAWQQVNAPENPALQAAMNNRAAITVPYNTLYFDWPTGPSTVYGFEPIPAELPPEFHRFILGPHAAAWLQPSTKLDSCVFPRLIALAEIGWSDSKHRNWTEFEPRMYHQQRTIEPLLASDVRIDGLQCEGLQNPLGIDTAKPLLSWILKSNLRGQRQTAYRILVADSRDALNRNEGNLWDSGDVFSDQSTQIPYTGKPLTSRTQCYWKVRVSDKDSKMSPWSEPASWSMGLLEVKDWSAKWIGLNPTDGNAEYPRLRKTFVLDRMPTDARVYVSSLGYHELYINGNKVGKDILSPAVTQLDRRAFYLTHDVTGLLRQGKNCIALELGRGWYVANRPGYANIQRPEGPVVRAQLEMVAGDGMCVTIATDKSWKASPGPFARTSDTWWSWSLRYDARLKQPGWDDPSYDDHRWAPAQECPINDLKVCAQMVETNRIIRTFTPTSIQRRGSDTWLIDMGTNLTGWLKLHVRGNYKPGHKIVVVYGDHLNEKGEPVGADDFDEYIAAGQDDEWFCCRFAYHGFRYAKIAGLVEPPRKEDLLGSFIRTGYPANSSFACSNQRLTAIHNMIDYTLECVTLGGYMVDCPHYERLGYGDGQNSTESAMMLGGMGPLHRSWMAAWRDCQAANGDMPHTAPSYLAGGGPMWCGSIIGVSWCVYQQNCDRAILVENYPAMQKWLEFFESHCKDGNLFDVWPNSTRRNWCLGDWAVPKGVDQAFPPSVKLVNNCYRVYCYDLISQIADVLDRQADATRYRARADFLRPIVHKAFYDPQKKTYAAGTQMDLAFPLLAGVVPTHLRADILKQLELNIVEKSGGHVGVGNVGVYVLVKALMNLERNDLIFKLVDKDTYPGWGYMLKDGATTTWEHWNGERSHIHNCYNGIGAWFYQAIGGIQLDPASPGFRHFIVKPAVVGDLTWARTKYESIRGPIVVEWKKENGQFELKVHVPANASATVFVPADNVAKVLEGGKPATSASGVKFLRLERGMAVFDVASGQYAFVSTL